MWVLGFARSELVEVWQLLNFSVPKYQQCLGLPVVFGSAQKMAFLRNRSWCFTQPFTSRLQQACRWFEIHLEVQADNKHESKCFLRAAWLWCRNAGVVWGYLNVCLKNVTLWQVEQFCSHEVLAPCANSTSSMPVCRVLWLFYPGDQSKNLHHLCGAWRRLYSSSFIFFSSE